MVKVCAPNYDKYFPVAHKILHILATIPSCQGNHTLLRYCSTVQYSKIKSLLFSVRPFSTPILPMMINWSVTPSLFFELQGLLIPGTFWVMKDSKRPSNPYVTANVQNILCTNFDKGEAALCRLLYNTKYSTKPGCLFSAWSNTTNEWTYKEGSTVWYVVVLLLYCT